MTHKMKINKRILNLFRELYPEIDSLSNDKFNQIADKINELSDEITKECTETAKDVILTENCMNFVGEASFFNKDPIKRTKNGKTKVTFVFEDKNAEIMKSMEELFSGNKKELYLVKSQKPLVNLKDSLFQKTPIDFLLESHETTK